MAAEQYDLLLNFEPHDECLELLLEVLRSDAFRADVEALGGYDLSGAGVILAEQSGS